MKLLGCAAFLLTVVLPIHTQPDFSGSWVAIAPPELAGQRLTVTQNASTVTLAHVFPKGDYTAEYGLDGKARVAPSKYAPGGRLLLSAEWQDDALILIDTTNVPGPRRILRTLSLDRNGMLVLELRTPQVAADQDPGMQSQAVLEASRIIYKPQ
jgi:hypothetical protein